MTERPAVPPKTEGTAGNSRPGWTDRLSRSKIGLALLSFAESTALPIPLEAVVVPLMVGHPKRALRIALIIWLGCILGASLFYIVGFALADPVVEPVIRMLGLEANFNDMANRLEGDGLFWSVFLVSLLPAPLQLATLGAGAVGGNFLVFLAAVVLSRGLRYFGMAILAQFIGERIAHLNIPRRYLVLGLAAMLLTVWGIAQLFVGS
ncbi:YqaA family protein [Roseovarius sp. D0-M9]|uniref:YqaA family protein n=1 Tax=Roseovarius sp. D0-M9 TaxID=3127117 RepID=UPI00300FE777